jgi:hypothetical protein
MSQVSRVKISWSLRPVRRVRKDVFATGQGKLARSAHLSGNADVMSIIVARKEIYNLLFTTVRLLDPIVKHTKSLNSILPFFFKIFLILSF